MGRYLTALLLVLLLGLGGAAAINALPALAQTQEELKDKLDTTNAQIQKLRDEIEQLQKQLNTTTTQKQTLQNAIKELDLQIQKLQKSVTLTTTQINQKDKEISTISGDITSALSDIDRSHLQIAQTLRQLGTMDNEPAAVLLLSGVTLSSFFDRAVTLGAIRSELQNRVQDLAAQKNILENSKTTAQQKRTQLAALQATLNQQKQGLSLSRADQNQLLTTTKNKESEYQALIAQKKAEQTAFENELVRLAAGLGKADTSTAPGASKGILSWPLSSVYITQYFGNTEFAQSGAYNGSGHNGIDFRAAIGTPVKAALSGVVQEINQGAVKYCQYGKWVLIKHDNGLTSLYAHLSSISAVKGQRVNTGDVIGYSGDTGYATGPHLHLTLYVSSAVTFKQYTCNSGYTAYIPIAPLNAYLNPLSYLPAP